MDNEDKPLILEKSIGALKNVIDKLQETRSNVEGQRQAAEVAVAEIKVWSELADTIHEKVDTLLKRNMEILAKMHGIEKAVKGLEPSPDNGVEVGTALLKTWGCTLVPDPDAAAVDKRVYKFAFGNDYYIKMEYDENQLFTLLDVQPHHKNYEQLKAFTENTQDIGGLLFAFSEKCARDKKELKSNEKIK